MVQFTFPVPFTQIFSIAVNQGGTSGQTTVNTDCNAHDVTNNGFKMYSYYGLAKYIATGQA